MRHHKIVGCISGLSPDVESEENLLPLSVCGVEDLLRVQKRPGMVQLWNGWQCCPEFQWEWSWAPLDTTGSTFPGLVILVLNLPLSNSKTPPSEKEKADTGYADVIWFLERKNSPLEVRGVLHVYGSQSALHACAWATCCLYVSCSSCSIMENFGFDSFD